MGRVPGWGWEGVRCRQGRWGKVGCGVVGKGARLGPVQGAVRGGMGEERGWKLVGSWVQVGRGKGVGWEEVVARGRDRLDEMGLGGRRVWVGEGGWR